MQDLLCDAADARVAEADAIQEGEHLVHPGI